MIVYISYNESLFISNDFAVPPQANTTDISISESGNSTAGETYSLVCSVLARSEPTITWLDQVETAVPSEMVITTGIMSTLIFNPLVASHAGNYTCRAMVEGQTSNRIFTVHVNAPGIDVSSRIHRGE